MSKTAHQIKLSGILEVNYCMNAFKSRKNLNQNATIWRPTQKPLEKMNSTSSEIHWSSSGRARCTLAFSLKMKARRLAVITEMSFFVTYKPFCISNGRKGQILEQEPWNGSKSRERSAVIFHSPHQMSFLSR